MTSTINQLVPIYTLASFFSNLNIDEESKLFEKVDDYWGDLDNLAYGSSEHNEILIRK